MINQFNEASPQIHYNWIITERSETTQNTLTFRSGRSTEVCADKQHAFLEFNVPDALKEVGTILPGSLWETYGRNSSEKVDKVPKWSGRSSRPGVLQN